jgi:hypothetical protein
MTLRIYGFLILESILFVEQYGRLASKLFIFICAGCQFFRGDQHSEVDANKNNRPLMRITNET